MPELKPAGPSKGFLGRVISAQANLQVTPELKPAGPLKGTLDRVISAQANLQVMP